MLFGMLMILDFIMFFFTFYYNVLRDIKFIILNIIDCACMYLIIVCKLKLYLNSPLKLTTVL